MAITISASNGDSIRTYLENLENSNNFSSVTITSDNTALTDGSNLKLVWEGSQYYLVEEKSDSIIVRNLDDCLPMTLTKATE